MDEWNLMLFIFVHLWKSEAQLIKNRKCRENLICILMTSISASRNRCPSVTIHQWIDSKLRRRKKNPNNNEFDFLFLFSVLSLRWMLPWLPFFGFATYRVFTMLTWKKDKMENQNCYTSEQHKFSMLLKSHHMPFISFLFFPSNRSIYELKRYMKHCNVLHFICYHKPFSSSS